MHKLGGISPVARELTDRPSLCKTNCGACVYTRSMRIYMVQRPSIWTIALDIVYPGKLTRKPTVLIQLTLPAEEALNPPSLRCVPSRSHSLKN
jgi:hypothetical protein